MLRPEQIEETLKALCDNTVVHKANADLVQEAINALVRKVNELTDRVDVQEAMIQRLLTERGSHEA